MVHRSSALAGKHSSLDIRPTPLSVRTLRARRTPSVPIAERVKGEFAEMRGFSPTLEQAARLFNVPAEECSRVLRSLEQDGSIARGEDGRYRRTD
jgi:hypothetical protein